MTVIQVVSLLRYLASGDPAAARPDPAPEALAEVERAVQAFIDCHVARPPRTRLGARL